MTVQEEWDQMLALTRRMQQCALPPAADRPMYFFAEDAPRVGQPAAARQKRSVWTRLISRQG